MMQFADHSQTVSIPRAPSIGWLKQVAHGANVWPDAETVPDAIWTAVVNYHRAMVQLADQGNPLTSREANG